LIYRFDNRNNVRRNMASRRLEGKAAIITGAASGIGRAASILFAREGARLALADMNEGQLDEVITLVRKEKADAFGKKTDVSVEEEVEELVRAAIEKYGEVDIVINNAGVPGDLSDPSSQSKDVWDRVFGVNVMGAVYTVKHTAAHMMERKKGAFVNVASVAGIRSGAGGNAYSASKAALINFTMTTACDLGGHNIRVNAVCPGLIETGMTKPVFDFARSKGKEDKLGSRCELRRYGIPEEVANAILFLASDEASYITGQALPVDGGNTASLNLPGMKV
jgi:meso-butanediol dehydrogenase/(S,S)-butanediol dehydrogenase/diacetyl reductase